MTVRAAGAAGRSPHRGRPLVPYALSVLAARQGERGEREEAGGEEPEAGAGGLRGHGRTASS
ncbi:hypothetical protein ABZT03_34965 [Streptomyces sp. NPDC005574]|uniref:hypothetical protein n=1 Tax=Streptomyces sp. NPDC005574 TaxID=3156891 RepID=UPI0033B738F5